MISEHIRGALYFDPNYIQGTRIILYEDFSPSDYERATKMFPEIDLYLVEDHRRDAVEEKFKFISGGDPKHRITNGFWTINLIFDFCGEVHVYGMADENICELVKMDKATDVYYHYYEHTQKECDHYKENTQESNSNKHKFLSEKKFYKKMLTENYKLHFHAPEWENIF